MIVAFGQHCFLRDHQEQLTGSGFGPTSECVLVEEGGNKSKPSQVRVSAT